MKVVLNEGAFKPERAYALDAGMDLKTPYCVTVEPGGSAIIDTGVHVEIPQGYAGMLKSKSGLNVKHGIIGEGVIDAGYTGAIVVKLYNLGDKPVIFQRGDKIIQLVVIPVCLDDCEIVESLDEAERGNAGFGSTGR